MKNILITGGAGFIGTNMAIEAIKRGYEVVAFDNLWRVEVGNNIDYMKKHYKDKYKFVWGDVRNQEDFETLPKVDALIHLAANPGAITSVEQPVYDFKSNAFGTVNALQLARKFSIPFIYASTTKTMSDVINEIPMEDTGERYEPKPADTIWKDEKLFNLLKGGLTIKGDRIQAINDKFPIDGFGKWGHSPYGASKLSGELYVQEYHVTYGLPAVIFRMSGIYGLFQKGVCEQGWVDWFLRKIAFGDGKITYFGTGKQVRDILDGRDLANAYLNALERIDKVNGEIFTIGGGVKFNTSLIEAVAKIEEISGKKAEVTLADKRPADHDWYVSCNKKANELLSWEPKIGLEQALKDMIEQYKRR